MGSSGRVVSGRMSDWPMILAALIEAERRPFAWGRHDCCTFAADCVLAITGRDPLADLRGQWRTRTQALALLKRLGGLQQAVTDRLGPPLPNALLAQRGDIVLIAAPDEARPGFDQALALCTGQLLLGPAARGLGRVHLARPSGGTPALAAWRV